MKMFIAGTLVGIGLLSIFVGYTRLDSSCEEDLKHTMEEMRVVRLERYQTSQALAELFTKYQEAIRQIKELKVKDVKLEVK